MRAQGSTPIEVGDEFEVTALRVAHGGHMIGHEGGRVVFIRHALPGERVRVRVTDVNRRIMRADAIEIITPAADRVEAPCRWSGPGGCGGCDFQHVEVAAQRRLKSEVLRTSLQRFAGLDDDAIAALDTEVRELPGHPDGLRWRTRVSWARRHGIQGLRRHRSHDVVAMDRCLLAEEGHDTPGSAPTEVREVSSGPRTWQLTDDAFWQVHPELPGALVRAVMEFGAPTMGEQWWDLFAGVGLFASCLGEVVGPSGGVVAVEGSSAAVRCGRDALGDLPQVHFVESDVARWLASEDLAAPDGVVLDPPRTGAGAALMRELCEAEIPRLVYVACDPVALARDVGVAQERGYRLERLRAFDAFPMTHHLETVALLTRA